MADEVGGIWGPAQQNYQKKKDPRKQNQEEDTQREDVFSTESENQQKLPVQNQDYARDPKLRRVLIQQINRPKKRRS